MKYIALIPAYEPTNKLIEITKELKANNFLIIIVNDGSNDTYKDIFNKCRKYATILEYKDNHGKGYALKTGLKYIQDNYKDSVIVTMDCDGQHTIKDALKLCNYTLNLDNTILLGKRIRTKDTPIRSKIGNSITRFVFKTINGLDIYDTQTGLRAFKPSVIPFLLNIKGDRFDYEMNVLLEANKNKIKLKEETIETIYENNNKGSHFHPIKDSFLIYKVLLTYALSSFISFIIDYILYTIILLITNNLTLSNILARIISSNCNYLINKNYVFKDNKNYSKTIFKYYLLAIFILIINTLILNILVNNLSLNKYLSKIIVETVLFIISFTIQKRYIFKEYNEK